MAMIAGAGRYAEKNRPSKGRLVLLYQPAEETGSGARMILNDPAFEEFRPDFAFALHNLPGFPEGAIILKNGTIASASTGFIARLQGETSHAGHPERGRNPAMAASQLMAALVALPQMETGLHEPALVTPINMRVGREAFGTSAGSADVMVTVRAHDTDIVDRLLDRARELAEGYARTFRLDVTTETTEPFKAVLNDDECVETLRTIARKHNYDVVEREDPFSWSEDFGVFTHEFRGALFGLGAGTETPGLHNSNYDFPDGILQYGVTMFQSLIDHYLM
jgi:amidohydrolase